MANPRRAALRRRAVTLLMWGCLIAGILLRLRRYMMARGLDHDEVLLTLNFRERSWVGLLSPLGHDQAAPVGFLWLCKLALTLGGYNEYVLRAVPFLASAGAPVVAWAFFRRHLAKPVLIGFLTFLAVSEYLIFYGAVAKQYCLEALFALALVGLALDTVRRGITARRLAFLAFAGALVVWCSHTSVFALAGVGTYLLARCIGRKERRLALITAAAIGAWLASFGLNYWAISRHYSNNDYLSTYWANGFAPMPPHSLADLAWYWNVFAKMVAAPLALKFPPLVAGGCIVGAVALWKTCRELFWLTLLPIAFTVLAAMAHQYPFDGRLILFLVPLVLLLLAHTLALEGFRGHLLGRTLFALMLVYPVYLEAKYLVHFPINYDVKPAITYAAEHYQPGDTFYLQWGAKVVGTYYVDYGMSAADRSRVRGATVVPGADVTTTEDYTRDLAQIASPRRVWVIFAIRKDEEQQKVLSVLDQRGHLLDAYDDGKGAAFLYSFDNPAPHTRPTDR